ncbi:MAG: hypothetical protein ABIQ61_02690 [Ornithinibacter sp.]
MSRSPARVAHVLPDGWADSSSRLFLMKLPDGDPMVLDGSLA